VATIESSEEAPAIFIQDHVERGREKFRVGRNPGDFSLVAFFLGSTPFETPANYSLLNYTEMRHNGTESQGGDVQTCRGDYENSREQGVKVVYNTEVVKVEERNGKAKSLIDQHGRVGKRMYLFPTGMRLLSEGRY
jgi:hypothetical protein